MRMYTYASKIWGIFFWFFFTWLICQCWKIYLLHFFSINDYKERRYCIELSHPRNGEYRVQLHLYSVSIVHELPNITLSLSKREGEREREPTKDHTISFAWWVNTGKNILRITNTTKNLDHFVACFMNKIHREYKPPKF